MRLIHTADLHLGNRMYDIDRNEEFSAFFRFLKDKIDKTNTEVLVISGDVYDKINPSNDAKRIYHDFLASIQNSCCKNVIIVGGNHDSGELLDSEKELLGQLNIHVVGQISNIPIEDTVFELKDKNDNVSGICAAVPFVSEGELRNFFNKNVEDGTFSDEAYGALYKKVLEVAKKLDNGRNLPLIATGHLYAAELEGKRASVKQTEKIDDGVKALDVVGNLGFVSEKVFPKEFDYVALGHIHYSTMVAKNPKIRYSGSPFVMGFDETNQERDILLVDIEKSCIKDNQDVLGTTKVEKIKVPEFYKYRRISGNSKTIADELKKYTEKISEQNTYLEIYFKSEDGIDIHIALEDELEKLPENVSIVNWRMQKFGEIQALSSLIMDTDEIKKLSPREIFTNLILSKMPVSVENDDKDAYEKAKNEKLERYLGPLLKIAEEVEKKDWSSQDEN